ncbi:DUF3564 family protein [Paraburkholderia sacchari]|uniref:DUF3564 family protein n=1 Tax=Paraburkholderia sacchari TaxID=159450 RepID=UPI001BD1901B|nr:DUF3564 family protein [Paraburkholderia sacchari]
MRLTILINGSDPTVNHDFAVVWLDMEQKRWSRESHQGVRLPAWGDIREIDGELALCAPEGQRPLCEIRGLNATRRRGISTAQGQTTWPSDPAQTKTLGCWRLQAVERGPINAEDALFAGH